MEWMRALLVVTGALSALLAGTMVLLAVRVPALRAARWWGGAWLAHALFLALGTLLVAGPGIARVGALPPDAPWRPAVQLLAYVFAFAHLLLLPIGAHRLAAADAARDEGARRLWPLVGAVAVVLALAVCAASWQLPRGEGGLLRNVVRHVATGLAYAVSARLAFRAAAGAGAAVLPYATSLRALASLLVGWSLVRLAQGVGPAAAWLLGDPAAPSVATQALVPVLDVLFQAGLGVTMTLVLLDERTRLQRAVDALRARVARAEQLDTVGRMASGLAHDFGNLLAVLQANVELLAPQVADRPTASADLGEVRATVERATLLVRELRDFGRRQVAAPAPLDPGAMVRALEPTLARLLGARAALRVELVEPLPTLVADRAQLERVLVNLVVNARDAMPDGGTCTVRVAPDGTTGLVLAVRDTGVGMSPEVRARLFEPFWTTKPDGTGLGLPTVLGIVQQGGGRLDVDSAPGAGATFTIRLPLACEAAPLAADPAHDVPRDDALPLRDLAAARRAPTFAAVHPHTGSA